MSDTLLFSGNPNPRDWVDDTSLENGNYFNLCVICEESFVGYKRRTVCKVCQEIMDEKFKKPEEKK